jgi:hypothetical protein
MRVRAEKHANDVDQEMLVLVAEIDRRKRAAAKLMQELQ